MAEKRMGITIEQGCFTIQGVHPIGNGYNFTFEAPETAETELLLYHRREEKPFWKYTFRDEDRIGRMRSIRLSGPGFWKYEYNFSVDGKIVQDPYAHAIEGRKHFGEPFPEDKHKVRCGLLPQQPYDWEGTVSPQIPMEEMLLYKVHVRGYTRLAGSKVRKKGTIAGLQEMIPYWKELGINAIELMPVYDFAEVAVRENDGLITEKKDTGRVNLWGYISGSYFAPKRSYCATDKPENEMRDFVKALHREGMECILEFYFPKTVNQVLALRALQFWKLYYHIDGFHIQGEGLPSNIAVEDGLLSETKLFVPGYDFHGYYNGKAPARRTLGEYNGNFQEVMRRFLKSDEDMVDAAMYMVRRNSVYHGSVNYMTSQDGFTLLDLVSYNYRHNEDNGQENQDGCSYNYSWNCGVEGPTRKAAIRKIREKQIRNAFLLLYLSQGTPMLYGGDEFGNSQGGNNNVWCQDNPVGWTDWRALRRNADLLEYVRKVIDFRKKHPILHMPAELRGSDYKALGFPDISFHGERAWYVNKDNASRMFGVMYNDAYAKDRTEESRRRTYVPEDFLFVAYNFHWEEREFALPNLPKGIEWTKVIDTSADWKDTFREGKAVSEKTITAGPRSILVLEGREAAPEESRPAPEEAEATPEDLAPVPEEVETAPEDLPPVPEDRPEAPADTAAAPEDTSAPEESSEAPEDREVEE